MNTTTAITTDSQLQKAVKQAIADNKETAYPIAGLTGLTVRIRPNRGGLPLIFATATPTLSPPNAPQ